MSLRRASTLIKKSVPPIQKINKLREQIQKAREAYYNSSFPVMTDQQFDIIYRELENLEKQ